MTPAFDEVWRWAGWTTSDEEVTDGAVDSEENFVLVGSQGYEAVPSSVYDDTSTDAFSGNFAAVKLSGAGELLGSRPPPLKGITPTPGSRLTPTATTMLSSEAGQKGFGRHQTPTMFHTWL